MSFLTPLNPCLPLLEVNRMYSDSGVVIRMCGGLLAMLCRWEALVSPVLSPTRISGAWTPLSSALAVISASGPARFLSMSLDSAFSGETYTICVTSSSPESSPSRIRSSMHFRNAASVLPEPVGAEISVCFPCAIDSQPRAWASVGP